MSAETRLENSSRHQMSWGRDPERHGCWSKNYWKKM
jgi:hypothetical protein